MTDHTNEFRPCRAPDGWSDELKERLREMQCEYLGTPTPEIKETIDARRAVERLERTKIVSAMCGLMHIDVAPADPDVAAAMAEMTDEQLMEFGESERQRMLRDVLIEMLDTHPPLGETELALCRSIPREMIMTLPPKLGIVAQAMECGVYDEVMRERMVADVSASEPDELSDPDRDPVLVALREQARANPFTGETVSLNDIFAGEDEDEPVN